LNTQLIDPALKSHYLLQNRQVPVTRVVSNSFGFGGSNCSLVLGRVTGQVISQAIEKIS
jgi:3-oxoacyl-[acyl-carrier-protein] synthase-1